MGEAYKAAGVNVEAGYEAVDLIKKQTERTKRPGASGPIGAFGGLFDFSTLNMKQPVLVSGTDGVGTKLMLAIEHDRHNTIGIDAVAMCVNDVVTHGAEPLFFLDYIACGQLQPDKIAEIVEGIADGCVMAGCSLVGGETAEMPGMYATSDYDVAGFTVGAVEKQQLVTGNAIESGDVLIGLAANGIHSNGFSLVRKVLQEANVDVEKSYDGMADPLIDELLKPTRIYVKPVLNLLDTCDVHGIAHITGGGLEENVPRMLPDGLCAEIDLGSWPEPAIFDFIRTTGNLTRKDLFATFNMGIGMVLAVPNDDVNASINMLEQAGESAYIIGRVKQGSDAIEYGGIRL